MIYLSNISKQFGSKIIFDGVTVSINPKFRTAFIGPNGAGKTVLLRILTGQESVDAGEVIIPSNLSIGYLPQEIELNQESTPIDLVVKPFEHLFSLEKILEQLSAGDTMDGEEYQKTLKAYDRLLTQLHVHGGFGLHHRAKTILSGLGIPPHSWEKPLALLSGGFQMRVLLAQLLLYDPDFLLLDEPTNHLDMDSLIWLEKFIGRFKGGILVVSHDRDFLLRVTTHTMEIGRGSIMQYNGPVNEFLNWKEELLAAEMKRTRHIQSQIDKTERFIERFKAKNTKASQARSKMKQVDRLKEELPKERYSEKTIHFLFPQITPSGSVPIKLENISVRFGELTVFENLSLTINRGDRIAIIGPNGAGKSTLLKTCFGTVIPNSGTVTLGHNTILRYYSQHRLDQLDPEKTVYEMVSAISKTTDKHYIQTLLGAFLFSGHDIDKKVAVLSGGEKSRLSLALLLADPGNCMLLDEPTNHLDIQSVECLCDALSEYEGTICIVSHDEYFISRLVHRIIELRSGLYRDFPGTLGDYRSYIEAGFIHPLEEEVSQQKRPLHNDLSVEKADRMQRREEKKKLERQIERLERSLEAVEREIAALTRILHAPHNATHYTLLHETQIRLDTFRKEYEELFASWHHLQERYEIQFKQ